MNLSIDVKVERVWKIRKIRKAAKGHDFGIKIFPARTNLISVANRIIVAAR